GCFSSFFDVFLDINSLDTPTFAPIPAICAGTTLSPLPTTSLNLITGTWAPAIDNLVTTTYTFTPESGQCAAGTTLTIVVNPLPVVDAGIYGAVCEDAADIALSGSPLGGVWTGTGVIGTGPYTFDPSSGTQTLTYTYTDGNFCVNSDETTITVNPLPLVDAGIYSPVCADAADITLGGTPESGVWTGNGVSGSGPYVFDPSAGTQTLTYTFTDGNSCSAFATTVITVNPLPIVVAGSYGPSCSDGVDITLGGSPSGGEWTGSGVSGTGPYVFDPSVGTQTLTYTYTDGNSCVNSAITLITVNLVQTVDPGTYGPVCIDGDDITLAGTPAGGIWTGPGVSGSGPYYFDPSVGTQTLTYTYSDGGSCSNSATAEIIVNPIPTVDAGTYGTVCIDAADIALGGSPAGGVWSGTGVTGNLFDPSSGTQTLTYTFTDANLCVNSDQTTIVVNPLSAVDAGTYGPVCIDGADITLAGSPEGGVWSGTGVSGNLFDPSVGTQTLTYTVTDANLCVNSAQTTITVNPLPTVNPGTYGPVCIDGADIILAGSPEGGVWSGTGITGNQFDPSVGTQTLTYTVTDANLCVNSAQTTITVNPLPTVTAGSYGPVCIDAADITLGGTPTGGIWSGTGVTGNLFDPSSGTQTLTYTFTDANLCVNSDQTTIVVNPLSAVDAGTYGPVCIDGADITLAGSPEGGVWSGTGVSGNLFDPSVGTQTLTYTVTDANLCVNSAQTTITVNPLPTVNPGTYGPVCIDGADITLTGSPEGGAWSGTGITGNQFDPSVGTQTLTYTVTDANLCVNSAQTTIIVNPLPEVSAGTYGPVDINDPDIVLAGSPAGGIWTGTGVGGSYVFDPSAGTQTLTYTYTDGNSCVNSAQTTIIVTEPDPVLTVTPPSQNVGNVAGSTIFTVTSNKTWVANSDQLWCTVTPSGSGNGSITAVYSQNTTTSARTANITVTVAGLPPVIVTVTQASSEFLLSIRNVTQTALNAYEFDIYLLDVDASTPLQLATIQEGITFNTGILNGAPQTIGMTTIISSELPSNMQPNGANTATSGLIKIAGRAAPGAGNGYIVSTVAPGTLIARVRMTNAVPFTANSTPDLAFTPSTALIPSYATRVAKYEGTVNTQMPVTPGNNAIVIGNPVLNGPTELTVTPPSRNVTSPDGSVTYTVTSNTEWTAISDQPWCSVTPSGFGNGLITATYTQNTASLRTAVITVTVAGLPSVDVTLVQDGKVLNLGLLLEGLYAGGGTLNQAHHATGPQFGPGVADVISVELHNSSDYSIVEFPAVPAFDVELSTNGLAKVAIPSDLTGDYYITVKHRNSLEITSADPVSFVPQIITYAFDQPSKAYGGNLLLMIDGGYAIFGGDINQDGVIDTGDITPFDNDQHNYVEGYVVTDVNGDGIIDGADGSIIDNNQFNYVSTILP
ncbi:MAG: hypothetical protein IPH20_19025, partial [Bacteroidales bacterium]|nr:hypothetical protein [Bacteroidales bacterium]